MDVERVGKSHVIHLDHGGGFPGLPGPAVRFVLSCKRPEGSGPGVDLAALLGESWGTLGSPSYAFVARIRSVRRSDPLRVNPESINTSRRWIAEGECLALRPVPKDNSAAQNAPEPTTTIKPNW